MRSGADYNCNPAFVDRVTIIQLAGRRRRGRLFESPSAMPQLQLRSPLCLSVCLCVCVSVCVSVCASVCVQHGFRCRLPLDRRHSQLRVACTGAGAGVRTVCAQPHCTHAYALAVHFTCIRAHRGSPPLVGHVTVTFQDAVVPTQGPTTDTCQSLSPRVSHKSSKSVITTSPYEVPASPWGTGSGRRCCGGIVGGEGSCEVGSVRTGPAGCL